METLIDLAAETRNQFWLFVFALTPIGYLVSRKVATLNFSDAERRLFLERTVVFFRKIAHTRAIAILDLAYIQAIIVLLRIFRVDQRRRKLRDILSGLLNHESLKIVVLINVVALTLSYGHIHYIGYRDDWSMFRYIIGPSDSIMLYRFLLIEFVFIFALFHQCLIIYKAPRRPTVTYLLKHLMIFAMFYGICMLSALFAEHMIADDYEKQRLRLWISHMLFFAYCPSVTYIVYCVLRISIRIKALIVSILCGAIILVTLVIVTNILAFAQLPPASAIFLASVHALFAWLPFNSFLPLVNIATDVFSLAITIFLIVRTVSQPKIHYKLMLLCADVLIALLFYYLIYFVSMLTFLFAQDMSKYAGIFYQGIERSSVNFNIYDLVDLVARGDSESALGLILMPFVFPILFFLNDEGSFEAGHLFLLIYWMSATAVVPTSVHAVMLLLCLCYRLIAIIVRKVSAHYYDVWTETPDASLWKLEAAIYYVAGFGLSLIACTLLLAGSEPALAE